MTITPEQVKSLIDNITEKSSLEENKLRVWIPMKLNDLIERLRKKTKGQMKLETLESFVRDDLLDEITKMRDYQSSVEKKVRFFEELYRKLIENKPFDDEEKHFLKTELLIFQHTEFPKIINEITLFEEKIITFLNERFNIMFVDSKDIERDEKGLYRRIYEREHTFLEHRCFTQKGEQFHFRKYQTRYYEVDDKMLLEEEDEEEPRITRATHESIQQRGAELEKHRKKHSVKKVMISSATKKFRTMCYELLKRYNTATKSPNKNFDDCYAEFEEIQSELAKITDNFEKYSSKIIQKCNKYRLDLEKS